MQIEVDVVPHHRGRTDKLLQPGKHVAQFGRARDIFLGNACDRRDFGGNLAFRIDQGGISFNNLVSLEFDCPDLDNLCVGRIKTSRFEIDSDKNAAHTDSNLAFWGMRRGL